MTTFLIISNFDVVGKLSDGKLFIAEAGMEDGLSLEKSEPACFDKEDIVLIDYHRYVLALLCDKEHVIDELPGYYLAFLASS